MTHVAPAPRRQPFLISASLGNPGLVWPLALSAAGWAGLLSLAQQGALSLCLPLANWSGSIKATLYFANPDLLGLEWAWMVLAMMGPLAAISLGSLSARTAPAFKLSVTGCALLGYLAVWFALGGLVVPLLLIFQSVAFALDLPGVGLGLLAYLPSLLWAKAALRLRRLPILHRVPLLGGQRQWASALRYGVFHGLRCARSCLPIMVAPMLAGQGLLAMALVTHILLAERIAHFPKRAPLRLAVLLLAALSLAGAL